MKLPLNQEGSAIFLAPKGKISKELPVFYNPAMKSNRDIAVLLLKALGAKKMKIADILAGTGIRSIRFLKELPKTAISQIVINDMNPNATKLIKKNLALNKLINKKTEVFNTEANKLLLDSKGFDYIDIDPFGSPNPFLDSALKRLSRKGILAITATDTAALAGSSPEACKRKYWAKPLRNEFMHETALRILIRKAQLVGSQYEKPLVPIFCHSTLHYVRAYLAHEGTKKAVRQIIDNHGYILYCAKCGERTKSEHNYAKCQCGEQMDFAGPVWLGQLWNQELAEKMFALSQKNTETSKILMTIQNEAKIQTIGFYDIPAMCKKAGLAVPRKNDLFEAIAKTGYNAAETHFAPYSIRTQMPINSLKKLIAKIKNS